jgi:hypothetical protein
MPIQTLRRSLFALCGAATALALTTASPVWAAEKTKWEPFKAVMTFSEQLAPPSAECFASAPAGGSAATGHISGSGMSSNFGAFGVRSQDCITSAGPYPMFTPPFSFSSNAFVLTASNGDQLVAQYAGTAQVQSSGMLALSGTFTFTGGTGRFAGVQGSGTLEGVEAISADLAVPAKGFVMMSGKISR